eukprot:1312325-Ditylum_brightwellii.AAC.1
MSQGKMEAMILYVTEVVDRLHNKKIDRKDKTTTKSIHAIQQHDIEMDKFCLVIDNYFTLPHVIRFPRENKIGLVGTSRMRKGYRKLRHEIVTLITSDTLWMKKVH